MNGCPKCGYSPSKGKDKVLELELGGDEEGSGGDVQDDILAELIETMKGSVAKRLPKKDGLEIDVTDEDEEDDEDDY